MTAHFFRLIGAGVASATLLAACGGGGGGTPATTTSFALSAGYAAYIKPGTNKSFNVAVTQTTGTCSGTATIVTTPAPQTTFEGFTAYPLTQDSTLTLTNCALTSSPTHGITYYNANYVPIGLAITGGDYAKFDSAQPDQLALPASVTVGATATFDTLTSYTDSTKAVRTGTRALSYQIVADGSTSTTAIANIVTVFSDVATPAANVLSTQTSSYRIAADGTLTLLSIDVQFSAFADPKQTHLVYTATN